MKKIISTLSSASAGGALAYTYLGQDLSLSAIGALAFGGAGYTIAYIGIPRLLENKMLGVASTIGLMMSLTWLMNGGTVYDIYYDNLCTKIDAKYHQYKDDYKNSTMETVDTKDKEKEILTLKYKIEKENSSISNLENETSKNSDYYRRLRESTKSDLLAIKNSNLKAWKRGAYKEYAKDYRCENPSHISFKRLVNCATDYSFMAQSKSKLEELSHLKEERNSDLIKFNKLSDEVKTTKENANNSNALIRENIAKFKKIEEEATKQGEQAETYIYLIMWAFGLFIELIAMMFNELVDARREKITKKETVKEINKVYKEAETREYNRACMKRVITYANLDNDPLKISFKTLLKGGRRGKILAISNSIMGAFLYAFTLKKDDKIIESWEDITPANILYVNGSAGTEFINKKERRKVITKFFPNLNENVDPVNVLGSTATELKNKDIWEYLGNRGSINPQQEALNYLVELEKSDKDRFSPLKISVKDLEAVATKFVQTYHPKNFI